MGRIARAFETAGTLAATLGAAIPFSLSLGRSLFTARAERRRVLEALRRWDGPPPPPPDPPAGLRGRVFVVAGEPSGDRLAAGVVRALRRRDPGVEVRGFGGAELAAAGARLDHDLASDAVMGFFAVVAAAPRIVRLWNRYLRILDEERPDAVLLVDYPGFNIRAANAARARGIPVAWYVVPSAWAWAPWRARRIGRAATDPCVVLPFERAFYADRGIAVRYVGYPVFEALDAEGTDSALASRLREGGRPVLALLPGSRRQEIRKNLDPMLAALARLVRTTPDVRPVIACALPRLRPAIEEGVRASGLSVEILDGNARTLLSVARAALCVSGTVTMECVHARVPAVVVYSVAPLNRALMPVILTAPWFGLANLLAAEVVQPEHANPAGEIDAIAREVEERLREGPARDACLAKVEALRARVATTGVADRVAAVLEARMGAAPPVAR